jgi:hypothetical protein
MVTTNYLLPLISAAIEIGGPAVVGINSFRPVTLRPRLSVGFALGDFAGLGCRSAAHPISRVAMRNRDPVSHA